MKLTDRVDMECLECTYEFIVHDELIRMQEKVYCPKCGKTNIQRANVS